jgi:hypothetical protein
MTKISMVGTAEQLTRSDCIRLKLMTRCLSKQDHCDDRQIIEVLTFYETVKPSVYASSSSDLFAIYTAPI